MKILKTMVLSSAFALSFSGFADKAADKAAVDSACKADAATAGCGSEQVGSGLLKCLHAYKEAHPEFKVSDACKGAMKQLRADKAPKS